MATESVAGEEKLRKLRADRHAEIADTTEIVEGQFHAEQYIYFLLEPSRDVVKYVGICVHPKARYSAHLGAHKRAKTACLPAARWIKSLVENDELPRMWVVAKVQTCRWTYTSHLDCTDLARTIERRLIRKFCRGCYTGNGDLKARLLNIEHMPDIFLVSGLDVEKDQ